LAEARWDQLHDEIPRDMQALLEPTIAAAAPHPGSLQSQGTLGVDTTFATAALNRTCHVVWIAREPTAKALLREYTGSGALAPPMRRVACAFVDLCHRAGGGVLQEVGFDAGCVSSASELKVIEKVRETSR